MELGQAFVRRIGSADHRYFFLPSIPRSGAARARPGPFHERRARESPVWTKRRVAVNARSTGVVDGDEVQDARRASNLLRRIFVEIAARRAPVDVVERVGTEDIGTTGVTRRIDRDVGTHVDRARVRVGSGV